LAVTAKKDGVGLIGWVNVALARYVWAKSRETGPVTRLAG